MENTRRLKRGEEEMENQKEKVCRLKRKKEVERVRRLKRKKEVERVRWLKRRKEMERVRRLKRREEMERVRRLKRRKKDERNMWLKLPVDILITILLRLDLVDCIHAGAVCGSWRAALLEIMALNLHPPSHRIPWLISFRPLSPQRKKIYSIFNLSNNMVYRIHLPQAFRARWLGSFGGWLILMDRLTNECFLLNVTSKERIQLPRQALVWNSAGHRNVEDFWEHGLGANDKAILSSDPISGDCAVVIACSDNTFAFCRLGDEAWTALEGESGRYDPIADIVFYNGRVIIAHYSYELTIYELAPHPNSTKWKQIPRTEIEYPCNADMINVYGVHLVESCGELLVVLMLYYSSGISMHMTFCVFKMDMSGSRWIKVESLGDQMIFLGCSKSLSATGLSGFKGNRIYFTNAVATIWSEDKGVFDFEDGSVKSFPSNASYPILYRPIWGPPIMCLCPPNPQQNVWTVRNPEQEELYDR